MEARNKPLILYFYDAMCGWCYGFSPVISKAADIFENDFDFIAVSGGMITGENIQPISGISDFIKNTYPGVEKTTGITFGDAYLKLVDDGTYMVNSIKPSIAMTVFKSFLPFKSVEFAGDLLRAHMGQGRDLNTREIYLELSEKYKIDADLFLQRLNQEEFHRRTAIEFEEVKKAGITGFPAVAVKYQEDYFLIGRGYMNYEELAKRLLVADDNFKN